MRNECTELRSENREPIYLCIGIATGREMGIRIHWQFVSDWGRMQCLLADEDSDGFREKTGIGHVRSAGSRDPLSDAQLALHREKNIKI